MNIDEIALLSIVLASLILLLVIVRWSLLDYRWQLLLAMLLTFEGVSIALLVSKIPWYVGILLAVVAGWQLLRLVQQRPDTPPIISVGTRFMERVTNDGSFTRWFPFVGLMIAIADVAANAWFFNGRFGSNDWVVLAAAAVWVGYVYVPPSYFRERDFVFLFSNLLVVVMIIPVVGYNLVTNSPSDGTMTPGELRSVELLLTRPLENLLNLMGYEAFSVGDMLYYRLENGGSARVSIAQGCSGIYSVAVFVSAFSAFVATEYNRLDRKVVLLLLMGVLTAYFANLFRMAIIVIVGHYRGMEALEWAHTNAGWLIFLLWVGIFWSLVIRFLAPAAENRRT